MATDFSRLVLVVALAAPIALSGCETMEKLNPFAEKETPLPGERKPLFPQGVPGVDFNAPPPQPQNSNIPITALTGEQAAQPGAASENEPQRAQPSQAQVPPAAKSAPSAKGATSARKSAKDSDDPWSGTR